ncbi:hypothetical protein HPP92_018651 [Vanilla planifolia]|uniref:Uncharacterized protein n=1 Tax=Vanilla planifolia TaxID=51239 RepID=A0A835QII0_VANPL|nr:hypothetical protein HPP92_018651 [Vanilla planifolia]
MRFPPNPVFESTKSRSVESYTCQFINLMPTHDSWIPAPGVLKKSDQGRPIAWQSRSAIRRAKAKTLSSSQLSNFGGGWKCWRVRDGCGERRGGVGDAETRGLQDTVGTSVPAAAKKEISGGGDEARPSERRVFPAPGSGGALRGCAEERGLRVRMGFFSLCRRM